METKIYQSLCKEAKYIREEVFMKEQGFENEFDDIDSIATHIVLFDNKKPVATCRIFHHKKKEYHLGRVAVLKEYRHKHLGNKLIEEAEKSVLLQGGDSISLSAQCRVEPFYHKNGYQSKGEIYFDEHCEHIDMYKHLSTHKKPVIALTSRTWSGYPDDRFITQNSYMEALSKCGATFLSVVPTKDHDYTHIANMCDGLLLAGGADMHSSYYSEAMHEKNAPVIPSIDAMDIALISTFQRANKPILGICRGFQVLNVYFNGSLYQDLPSQYNSNILHSQKEARNIGTHTITIMKDSFLGKKDTIHTVNSFHHQAVKKLGDNLDIVAYSEDGLVEAFETTNITAVQWHPECMMEDSFHYEILNKFVNKCKKSDE